MHDLSKLPYVEPAVFIPWVRDLIGRPGFNAVLLVLARIEHDALQQIRAEGASALTVHSQALQFVEQMRNSFRGMAEEAGIQGDICQIV